MPQVDVLLRKNSKPQDPGLGPGSALLQAAGIFAIRAAPGSLWPHYAPGLMHLVYLAYNMLREQHHLAGIEESKQKEIAAAEKAIDNVARGDEEEGISAEERDSMNAQEQAKLDEQYRKRLGSSRGNVLKPRTPRRESEGAFLACVNAAKGAATRTRSARGVRQGRTTAGTVDKWLGREGAEGVQAGLSSPSGSIVPTPKKPRLWGRAASSRRGRKAGQMADLKDPCVLPGGGRSTRWWIGGGAGGVGGFCSLAVPGDSTHKTASTVPYGVCLSTDCHTLLNNLGVERG